MENTFHNALWDALSVLNRIERSTMNIWTIQLMYYIVNRFLISDTSCVKLAGYNVGQVSDSCETDMKRVENSDEDLTLADS